MDASGECSFYDEVMYYKKIFCTSFLLIGTFSLVSCSSGFFFESEIHPTNESGLPMPEVFGTEKATQASNQSLMNILMLITLGLVSMILLLMFGRR